MSRPQSIQTRPRWTRILLAIIGLGLALFGLIMPILGLPDLEGLSTIRLLMLMLAGLLIVISFVNEKSVAQWLAQFYRSTAITLLTVAVVLVIVEMISLVIWNIKLFAIPLENVIPPAVNLPYYQNVSWGKAYWEEYDRVQKQHYTPYTVWRQMPFTGEYINIDESGIRRTPGADCQPESYKVFVLGGSTIWGTGSPDDMTIPAYLQAELDAHRDGPVCVVNFGELGYVSTQEVVRLMLELRAGNMPDVAVFYDGLNDVYSAYQNGRAGDHQNLDHIAGRYELRPQTHPLIEWWWQSYMYKIINLFRPAATSVPGDNIDSDKLTPDALTNAILQVYTDNQRLVKALAEEYEFKYAFFWQPVLTASRKVRDGEEQKMVDGLDHSLDELYVTTYEKAAQIKNDNFYNIAGIFDDYDGLMWIDSAHIIPEGNQVIGQEIANVINSIDG